MTVQDLIDTLQAAQDKSKVIVLYNGDSIDLTCQVPLSVIDMPNNYYIITEDYGRIEHANTISHFN